MKIKILTYFVIALLFFDGFFIKGQAFQTSSQDTVSRALDDIIENYYKINITPDSSFGKYNIREIIYSDIERYGYLLYVNPSKIVKHEKAPSDIETFFKNS